MKTNIRKIGNSAGVILPTKLLKQVRLSEGKEIELSVDGNVIVITPAASRPRYELVDLLKQCDAKAPKSAELKEWDSAKPVGREKL